MDLTGKGAIVTGASSGIGSAIAVALGRAGMRVALAARDEEALMSIARSMPGGDESIVVPTDVTDEAQVERLVKRSIESFGTVDLLVNNAGFGVFKSIVDLTAEEFDSIIAVNLRGAFLAMKYLLPHMYERGTGTVVSISSLAGKHGFVNGGAYCSSKFGLMGLMECAFHEARTRGVRMVAICPGSVATPFFDTAQTTAPNLDRVLQPEDIAETVLHVVSLPERALVREVDIRPANPRG